MTVIFIVPENKATRVHTQVMNERVGLTVMVSWTRQDVTLTSAFHYKNWFAHTEYFHNIGET